MKRLFEIQQYLKVEKGRNNNFGGYKYRNASDILEAVKPLMKKHNLVITLDDSMKECAGRAFVYAVASLYDAETGKCIESAGASAEAEQHKKGMDAAQSTGSSSSYARKYALCGLFAIDDSKVDPDTLDSPATRAFNYINANKAALEYYMEKYKANNIAEFNDYQLSTIYNELKSANKL